MKKNLLLILLICVITLMISGCTSEEAKPTDLTQSQNEASSEVEKDVEVNNNGSEKELVEALEMKVEAFEKLIAQLPMAIVSTKYVVQDQQYKSLYPDLLQAVILNNTDEDIKDAVIAFVAWDENNLPLKLKGNVDFSDGSYVKEINYSDINLIGGATFGEGSGFALDQSVNVSSFKAIPVSFKTFDGDSWENPYYAEWKKLYEGNKFTDTMSVKVMVGEKENVISKKQNETQNTTRIEIDESELMKQLEGQKLKVVETNYVVQDSQYKSLYPDMLQVVLKNETDKDVENVVVAFVAWDENKLPVKIKGNIDFSDGSYVKLVNYNDINLVPGKTYGKNSGFELDEHHTIKSFKALVVSYESFSGETWENPLFGDWKHLYEGNKVQ